ADRGDRPEPRTDRNSQIAHIQLLEKAKRGGIDIYFEGDSITRRWGTSDARYRDFLRNRRRNFYGWNAADFGWGGAKVQNILWRLENGELDEVHPKSSCFWQARTTSAPLSVNQWTSPLSKK